MSRFKRLGWISFIVLAFFLLGSLPSIQRAEAAGNEPGVVTPQEATIPLSEKEVNGTDCLKLTFKLAGVALYREKNKSMRLIWTQSSPRRPDVYAEIGAGDFDLGWAPGMDASIMLHNPTFGVELRYLGLHQWDESASDFASDEYWDEYAGVGGKFRSALHNAELNVHWWPCSNDRFSWLAGFRWFRLTDKAFGWAYDQGGYYWNYYEGNLVSRNDLYGGQLGLEGLLLGKRDQGFSIDGGVKAGVFANKIRNHGKEWGVGDQPGYSYDYSESDSWHRTKTACLSEVVLNANYAFTKNIGMSVGYQFLYVSKVAVPINDFASTQSVMFHGGRLGLNIAF